MKNGLAVIILISVHLFLSCTTDVKDCICTTEFRVYDIIVIDSFGNSVDSLNTRITNSSGKEFSPNGNTHTHDSEGRYWIMDDSYIKEFSIRPTAIFLEGTKEDASVEAAFLFNTCECKCHVYKVAGPDTVVAQ